MKPNHACFLWPSNPFFMCLLVSFANLKTDFWWTSFGKEVFDYQFSSQVGSSDCTVRWCQECGGSELVQCTGRPDAQAAQAAQAKSINQIILTWLDTFGSKVLKMLFHNNILEGFPSSSMVHYLLGTGCWAEIFSAEAQRSGHPCWQRSDGPGEWAGRLRAWPKGCRKCITNTQTSGCKAWEPAYVIELFYESM